MSSEKNIQEKAAIKKWMNHFHPVSNAEMIMTLLFKYRTFGKIELQSHKFLEWNFYWMIKKYASNELILVLRTLYTGTKRKSLSKMFSFNFIIQFDLRNSPYLRILLLRFPLGPPLPRGTIVFPEYMWDKTYLS